MTVRAYISVLVSGILVGGAATTLAQNNPVFAVKGLALGTRVNPDNKAYEEYDCNPSDQFEGFTWCKKSEKEKEKRGPFTAYYSILHSRDGTIMYVNRFQEPAYWGAKEVQSDIEYYTSKIGEEPTQVIRMRSSGYPNGTIATWGKVVLEPVDAQSRRTLASGKDVKIGVMIDFIGNYERSAKLIYPYIVCRAVLVSFGLPATIQKVGERSGS
jgi:hypothetical protein